MKEVTLITDGACSPNPGKGGWAVILRYGGNRKEISGSVAHTTNNRMELTAIIQGLRALKEPCRVLIRTDSRNSISWCKPTSFKTPKKQAKLPEAYALVLEFREVSKGHVLTFEWVRGHIGDPDNERADMLATDQINRVF